MSGWKEAAVILSKCPKTHKLYGIRSELTATKQWDMTWAFPIKEGSAKREGYDQTSINGNLLVASEYPGCPYCGARHVVICSCGHVYCFTAGTRVSICEWCGSEGILGEFTGGTILTNADR